MAQQIIRINKVPYDFRCAGLTTCLEKGGVLILNVLEFCVVCRQGKEPSVCASCLVQACL